MSQIGELVVRFERCEDAFKLRRYPYLGQCCLLGVDHALLEGLDCKKLVDFSPRYGHPAGLIKMGEVLLGDRNAVERLDELAVWSPGPLWVLPAEGWRTARCLQAALEAGGAVSAGVVDIIGPLAAEVDSLVNLMNVAVESDIRFHVDMDVCPSPPEDLVLFVQRDFDETAALVREALEEAGIQIGDEEDREL